MLLITSLFVGTATLLAAAAIVLAIDAYTVLISMVPPPVRWGLAARLVLLAWLPLLPALSMVVVER